MVTPSRPFNPAEDIVDNAISPVDGDGVSLKIRRKKTKKAVGNETFPVEAKRQLLKGRETKMRLLRAWEAGRCRAL